MADFFEYYGLDVEQETNGDRLTELIYQLPEASRVKRAEQRQASGLLVPFSEYLQALSVDLLSLLLWTKTEDGQKGKNRPAMLSPRLFENGRSEETGESLRGYDTPEAFFEAFQS